MASQAQFIINSNFGLFRAGVIYTLTCPDTLLVRYVGKTFNPKDRFFRHHSIDNREKSKRALWVNGLISKNKKPIIDIIDDCDEFNWCEKEIAYIKLYKSIGAKLLNMSSGGEQGALNYKFTETQSEKLSKALKGKSKTKEHTENAKNARIKSLKDNPELKIKLAKISSNILKNMTEEQKERSLNRRRLTFAKRNKIKLCDFYKMKLKLDSSNLTKKDVAKIFDKPYSQYRRSFKKYING